MSRVVEWLNQNAFRRYPLVENADMATDHGTDIPDSLLLDFSMICYTVENKRAYLDSVTVAGTGSPYTVTVSFSVPTLGSFSFSLADTSLFPYTAELTTANYRVVAVFGSGIAALAAAGAAVYTLLVPAQIEPARLCFQAMRRVHSIIGSAEGSIAIDGDIYVKEGHNINIVLLKNTNTLRLDISAGCGAGQPCDELPADRLSCKNVFLRINGLNADDQGNFTFVAGPGLKLTNDKDNHKLTFISAKSMEETECAKDSGG